MRRKPHVLGFVLCCASVGLLAAAGVYAGSVAMVSGPGGPPLPTVPVVVTNFPAVQPVGGAVQVSNLPLDSQGNVKVASASATASSHLKFVGITQATIPPHMGPYGNTIYSILEANRACHAQFPGTRVCEEKDLGLSVPPPPAWDGSVVAAFEITSGLRTGASCYPSDGLSSSCEGPLPVSCCGP